MIYKAQTLSKQMKPKFLALLVIVFASTLEFGGS